MPETIRILATASDNIQETADQCTHERSGVLPNNGVLSSLHRDILSISSPKIPISNSSY